MPPKQKNGRPLRDRNHIEEKLNAIYQNENGELPDLSAVTRTRYSLFVRALVGLLTVAFVGALAAGAFFYFFSPHLKANQDEIELTAEGPEQTVIGAPITYTIRYRPQNGTVLEKARLQLHYPDGFMVSSTAPQATNATHTVWEWDALGQTQEGTITIEGTLFGNPEEEQSVRVFLTYQPKQFNTEFQKVTSVNTKTLGSPVQMSIEGNETATMGKETAYTIVITNIQEETFEGLTLTVPAGEGLDARWVEKQVEGLAPDTHIIQTAHGLALPALTKESSWRIPFVITFSETTRSSDKQPLAWALRKTVDEHAFTLAEIKQNVQLERNEFTLQLLINGKDTEAVVRPGEFLNVSTFYKNNGTQEVTDVEVSVNVDAPSANNKSIFDWQALVELSEAPIRGEQLNGDTRRGTITWKKGEIPDLAYLKAGENGVINFQLPIKNDSEVLDSYDGFTASVRATARVKTKGETLTVHSNLITLYLNSDTTLSAELLPADADGFISMLWNIDNTWHPLKNIRVSTKLFGNIEWKGTEATPAGSLSFNEQTGAVDWVIDELPLEAGALTLQFKFKLNTANPTQTALTDTLKLTAQDIITNKDIVLEHVEIPLPE